MAEGIDVGKHLKVIDECLRELYSDKIDLSKYKYRQETPEAYKTIIAGFERKDIEFISRGISALYSYTNPNIKENEIMETYGKDEVILNLFYRLSKSVKSMDDEINRAIAGTEAHAEAA